ncbi:uncharacterized protein J3D65DRAFT_617219 [Phyllosticta citribraziliensis]|uniref:Uncharacterized protein n=1 Tax=Phyllosticta citribraziliensis TaxID=989973 RepID=A0ABR1M0P7_9PEZI
MDARHQHQRPRSKSGFSFKSEKSDKSHDSKSDNVKRPKIRDLRETPAEKHKRHLSGNTKANPNAAMEEAQPIAQQLEAATLGSLRAIQHKDEHGNPISDPDLSNPTRSRWERPLDTIRKFEQQIDGEYKQSSNPEFSGYTSRRSSYHGGGYDPHRYNVNNGSRAGFYGSAPAPAARINDPWSPAPVQGPPRNRYGQRMVAPDYPRQPMPGQGLYPGHAYQHSRDTVNTGLSNSSGEHWPNSTDPSSENSSIERGPVPPVKDPHEAFAFQGFGGAPAVDDYDYGNQASYGAPPVGGNGVYYPPTMAHAPPNGYSHMARMGDGPPEQPISPHVNTNGPVSRQEVSAHPPPPPEKRKSWFKRRFSKE